MARREPANLEKQVISLIGRDINKKLWGRKWNVIIKRFLVRYTYDNNNFNNRYQGIHVGGYTRLLEALLEGTEVRLGVYYIANRGALAALAATVRFKTEILDILDIRATTW